LRFDTMGAGSGPEWTKSGRESAGSLTDSADSLRESAGSLTDSVASLRESAGSAAEFGQRDADLLGFCEKMEISPLAGVPDMAGFHEIYNHPKFRHLDCRLCGLRGFRSRSRSNAITIAHYLWLSVLRPGVKVLAKCPTSSLTLSKLFSESQKARR